MMGCVALSFIFYGCGCFNCPQGDPCETNDTLCNGLGQTCVFNTSFPDDYYCECSPGFDETTSATCTGEHPEDSVHSVSFVIIRHLFQMLLVSNKGGNNKRKIFTVLLTNILHLLDPICFHFVC